MIVKVEESKIPFWKKWKMSIFSLEEYQKLAIQKLTKSIAYIAILMLIFTFFSTICITYLFNNSLKSVVSYIDKNIETLTFKEGVLSIQGMDKQADEIIIDEKNNFNGKIIINTNNLSQEQINNYESELSSYANGAIVLKDKILIKSNEITSLITVNFKEISDEIHLVNVEKQDILNFANGSDLYKLDAVFFTMFFIISFVNNVALVLLDAILYAIIGYILGAFMRFKVKIQCSI